MMGNYNPDFEHHDSAITPKSKALQVQRALTQKTLVDFLQADLDLCFTILDTAHLASELDHYHSALENAHRGLQVIRKLAGRVEDSETSKTVNGRADELERALESFPDFVQSENQSTNI
jgi:hypothetical protein